MKYLFSTLFILCACGADRTAQVKQQPIVPQEITGPQGSPGVNGTNGTNGSSCSVYTIEHEQLYLCDQSGCTKETAPQGVSLDDIRLGALIECTDGSLSLLPLIRHR